MTNQHSSRLPGFFKRTLPERAALVAEWAGLTPDQQSALMGTPGLTPDQADHMIENVVGVYGLPLGIATNFLVNDVDLLVPMVVEEPSVVAAISNAARLFREGGGFRAETDEPIMIGQIQVLDMPDVHRAAAAIMAEKQRIMAEADSVSAPVIMYGGGARDLEVRPLDDTPVGPMLIIHLLFDTRDAMGANTINTAAEHLTPLIESITGGRVNLRILSNLADRRKARAEGMIPAAALETDGFSGAQVVRAIVEAGAFAEVDPYRAATHNKGIMNGIDAVVIATGNDWRAVEAGAHSYAAHGGRYTSLTHWWQDDDGNLRGRIELPMAVGTVGGATRVHPQAQVALKIMGVSGARQLSEILAAVGLAQNLAAIRALATVGIQQGHMRLHARQFAVAAGAAPDQIATVVQRMIEERNIRLERAQEIVQEMNAR